MKKSTRPEIDEYFLKIASVVAERSTCHRHHVGAVAVRDKHILATGYNGAPSGLPHCEKLGGCLRKQLNVPSGERHEICRAVHAEQNVLCVSSMYGASTRNTTLYCTTFPCVICAKLLVQSGVEQVVFTDHYGDELANSESKKIFAQAGTHIRKLPMKGA